MLCRVSGRIGVLLLAAVAVSSQGLLHAAEGGHYEVLHSMAPPEGSGRGHLMLHSDGRMYGSAGGSEAGLIFRISPGNRYTELHRFALDGGPAVPAGLVEGPDGEMYGASSRGGEFDAGTLFRMSRQGRVKLLYAFGGTPKHCQVPAGPMTRASDGRFYGVTSAGGHAGRGCTFQMTKDGVVTVLHEFANDGIDGARPNSAPVEASDGLLYGTTASGGRHDTGTLYRMNRNGWLQVIHHFHDAPDSADHGRPTSGLVEGPDGQLYGTADGGFGSIYRIDPATRAFTRLHGFDGHHGAKPRGALQMAPDGTITGTTYIGSKHATGNVYQWSSATGLRELHSFEIDQGDAYFGGIFARGERDFYGVTRGGGDFHWGSVYHLQVAP